LAPTATQTARGAQETDTSTPFRPAILAGALHERPLNTTAFPCWSTATHNERDAHETEFKVWLPSMSVGALHELPLNIRTSPVPSTPAQKDDDTQETPMEVVAEGDSSLSICVGPLHELPLNVSAFPASSRRAQNDDVGHETAHGWLFGSA
jgi:hypothetical protein